MELFKDFGFEPIFFTAQIINFLILAFIFKKFLYQPILKLLKEREEKINKGLADAQKATIVLEDANAKRDEIIKNAVLEAEKIIEETKITSEEVRRKLYHKSKQQADKLVNETRQLIETEREKLKIQAQDISVELAKRVLSRVLSDIFTEQEKEKILQRNIKLLEKYD